MIIAILTAIYLICGIYMILNFKHDIQMLQQNSYRLPRYWHYLEKNLTTAWRLVDVALLFLLWSTLLQPLLTTCLIAIAAIWKTIAIMRKKYKKPLVFTKRVWRIYGVTAALALAAYACTAVFTCHIVEGAVDGQSLKWTMTVLLLLTIFSWVVVMAAVVVLMPVEALINRRYYNDAARILRSMPGLTVVGITGSYGKTSTKHYLERILSEEFNTLMTPGSYNTTMGVIRTVREMMKPYHEVFICEMGAKQLGDIREIAELVHPTIGVVTAVGPMHLESFKTLENVRKTKFELVDALPADGTAVINNDFEPCRDTRVGHCTAVRYGVSDPEGADYRAEDIRYSPDGTEFAVVGPDGQRIELKTRLVGECNISNLMAATIVALKLGVPADKIRRAVASIEQVEHRLNMKRTPGGVTIIDDAFNSNPSGSRMAVDVLARMEGGKRIIVTPGMIELGDKQKELNAALGKHIGESVDVAIIVGEYNREALLSGIRESGMAEENVHPVASFDEAQRLLAGMLQPGDTVLYENDLPDTFK